ncbi:redox-sensitive transcriptional activator SoxR [Dactylosporangium cerinum]
MDDTDPLASTMVEVKRYGRRMPRPRTTFHELTVGQVADRSGVAISALHFYERHGLIRSTRTPSNQRRYSRDTLRRVAFIRASQHVGISLAVIRDALDRLPSERTPTREDWAHLSMAWRAELDTRIAQLQALRDDLTECIGCGCLSLRVCHLTNPRDLLGREGPGARRLPPPAAP